MRIESMRTVRSRLSAVVDSVHLTHERVVVTMHGEPTVVLIEVDDLDSFEETLAILRDEHAMRGLAQAEAEVTAGDTLDGDELGSTRPGTSPAAGRAARE